MSDPLDITVEQARSIVLQVGKSKGWVPPEVRRSLDPTGLEIIESMQDELGDVVETIATDIYSHRHRFILELIQNTEDCEFTRTRQAPAISFEVSPEKIIVESNEDGFKEIDVVQICHTGKSWKKSRPGYVGEKGIGFKSVFQVASKVHIQSNSFSFSFQYNGEQQSRKKLGIITPIPEDDPIPPGNRPLTRMTLTLNTRIPYSELVSHFKNLPNTLLLFLSKLREIRIKIHLPDQERSIVIIHRKSEDEAGITRLSRLFQESFDEWRYIVARTSVSELPVDTARPGINECEIVLAFPVDAENHPRISLQYDIFAFLPVSMVGFNFLIQADFILQANREEVIVDSAWNRKLVEYIAKAFCEIMLDFCKRSDLKFYWMSYLSVGNIFNSNPLWKELSSKMIDLLREENILYHHDSSGLFSESPNRPGNLRTLPEEYLDDDKTSPLFPDLPWAETRYLSLSYQPEDIQILRTAFNIRDIEDDDMFHRIYQESRTPSSRLKGSDEGWHTRASDLIVSMMRRSPSMRGRIKREIRLIPMEDGSFVTGSTMDLYLPAAVNEPIIPPDLVVTIQAEAARNPSRRQMFELLGAQICPPQTVIELLWRSYARADGASNLAASKVHLSYLYWHVDITDRRFSRLWLYDNVLRKITSQYKVIYLPSDDDYGPKELLMGRPDPRNSQHSIPSCPVSFVHNEYMDLFPPSTRRHDLTWLEWLQNFLGVRRVPRLKHDAGSLSQEIRHIIQYRPDKIIGTLGKYWVYYRRDIPTGSHIAEEISQSKVTCLDGQLITLSRTYFPLPILLKKTQELGIAGHFQFLDVPGLAAENSAHEDWRFLERFGVKFEENLQFYLDILIQHKDQGNQSWDDRSRSAILKTYELISNHYSERNRDMLLEVFHQYDLILHPNAFQQTSTAATWLNSQCCVWRGPTNLISKTPLTTVHSYRNNPNLTDFFCRVLGIQNANWRDYIDMLQKFRSNQVSPPDIFDKIKELYTLLSSSRLTTNEWETIINTFQTECLVYAPSDGLWFAPSHCLWTSPVPIVGKAIIGASYSNGLKPFFLERLRISPASLSTLVEGLHSLAQRQPSSVDLKRMIWAINEMDPKESDLESVINCDILPVRDDRYGSTRISFQNCQGNFVVIDRAKLATVFTGYVGFLDFTLEEVRQLEPFLRALKLDKKCLSRLCTEETTCTEDGVVDRRLTEELKDRAYYLLRCVVSNRSPLVTRGPQSLYDRLLATTVLRSDAIVTQYSITLHNGDVIGPITQEAGLLHTREDDGMWRIFVPRNRHNKEVCYRTALPNELTKLFKIPQSARELISNIINSSILVLDDILEHDGVGWVPGIEPPERSAIEDTDETETEDEVTEAIPLPASQQSPEASEGSETSVTLSRPETPSSSIVGEVHVRAAVYSDNLQRRPSLVYPEQDEPYRSDAYRELLDNVIRIAGRTTLPYYGTLPSPNYGPYHPNFDHEAAFGIRSHGEMAHDRKIGAAGELFVFECLLRMTLPSFDLGNWRSSIRNEVAIHPQYSNLTNWPDRETSDIVYKDELGVLTKFLIHAGYLNGNNWAGATPEYYIEVKTTTGYYNDRFYFSGNQYRMMHQMALQGQRCEKVYMICRVYNLGMESLGLQIYVDPYADMGVRLAFEAQNWTVTPMI
ncbi:hypothetical protein F5884DRAFT_900865 [Xylogone sp. PMI_703]|nr:hypothetical protein F5884DRAFT_900865 [Xylogone sp. PMI_703]